MDTITKSVWDSRVCLILIAVLTALTLTLFLWAGSGETVSANTFSSAPGLVSGQSTTVIHPIGAVFSLPTLSATMPKGAEPLNFPTKAFKSLVPLKIAAEVAW